MKTRDQVLEKAKDLIKQKLAWEGDRITEQTRFVEDMGGDSLDEVEIIMEAEDAFGIQIPDAKSVDIHTVGQLVDAISEELRLRFN